MVKKNIEPNHITADAYLSLPYSKLIVREADGSFRAEILEFPGCIATGNTETEALTSLQDVACGWVESALANGLAIPAPSENTEYSGKFVLRMPKSLHRRAALAAEREGVSLNQFIVSSVAEQIGMKSVSTGGWYHAQVAVLPAVFVSASPQFVSAPLQHFNVPVLSSDNTYATPLCMEAP